MFKLFPSTHSSKSDIGRTCFTTKVDKNVTNSHNYIMFIQAFNSTPQAPHTSDQHHAHALPYLLLLPLCYVLLLFLIFLLFLQSSTSLVITLSLPYFIHILCGFLKMAQSKIQVSFLPFHRRCHIGAAVIQLPIISFLMPSLKSGTK